MLGSVEAGYIEELIAARRRSFSDDLISELIRAEDGGDQLSHDHLVNLAVILLNAGTDTTRNQLAAAVQTLTDHPDQWELLARYPVLAGQDSHSDWTDHVGSRQVCNTHLVFRVANAEDIWGGYVSAR